MKNTFLSRFTPSSMTPETIEALFVQRHQLVEDLIEVIRESALTKSKHFRLLVGGRGMGKTYTISLIYHRLSKMDELKDKLLIAWMREEEWGISSFLDLLLRIFRALEKEYPEEYKTKLEREIKFIYGLSADEACDRAGRLLKKFVGDRTLLLLMENLDDIFSGLGDIGQKQFRAYIQNYSFITILATTQRLFAGVKQKNSPFYGFFYPQYLELLELDEVIDLLGRIAKLEGKKDLFNFIQTPTGRDRIKAIHYLAGGNHRVYVIFAEFITRDSLDELVEPFMKTLDELTPYYQARMQWLSPQQRKIVDFLGDRRHPVTVKEIAQHCFITHQTASSQLKDLRNKGYVRVEAIGRESFYDLQEVLMRFCLDVKKQRGEPISLFVDFLRCWYPKEELQRKWKILNSTPQTKYFYVLERQYIEFVLNEQEKEKDPRILAYIQEGNDLYNLGKYEEAVANYDRALKILPNNDAAIKNRGITLFKLERYEEAVISFHDFLNIKSEQEQIWCLLGLALFNLEKYEKAIVSFEKAIKINPKYDLALSFCGFTFRKLKQYKKAINVFERIIEINPNDSSAWYNLGNTLDELDKLEEAIPSYERAIEFDCENDLALLFYGIALRRLGKYEEAITSLDRALKIVPNDYSAWINRGVALVQLFKYEEAVTSLDRALENKPESYLAWNICSWALIKLERYSEALESCDRAIELNKEYYYSYFHRAITLLRLNRWDESIASLKDALARLTDGEIPSSQYIELIIYDLFNNVLNQKLWKNRIETILKIFDNYKLAFVLGLEILRNIPTLMSEMTSDKAAQIWLETWQELTSDRPEFQIPLRFLNTAVRYKQTKGDRKVLLELAIEERQLLEPLLEQEQS